MSRGTVRCTSSSYLRRRTALTLQGSRSQPPSRIVADAVINTEPASEPRISRTPTPHQRGKCSRRGGGHHLHRIGLRDRAVLRLLPRSAAPFRHGSRRRSIWGGSRCSHASCDLRPDPGSCDYTSRKDLHAGQSLGKPLHRLAGRPHKRQCRHCERCGSETKLSLPEVATQGSRGADEMASGTPFNRIYLVSRQQQPDKGCPSADRAAGSRLAVMYLRRYTSPSEGQDWIAQPPVAEVSQPAGMQPVPAADCARLCERRSGSTPYDACAGHSCI